MRRSCLLALSLLAAACGGAAPASPPPADAGADAGVPAAALLGGETTVWDTSGNAYSFPARNLSRENRDLFSLGDHYFNRNWITAPASVSGGDGLGPTFNATSCSACHQKDGRGRPPEGDGAFESILLRLSVPGADAHGGPLPEPAYGGQLQPHAILGVPAEGRPHVRYEEVAGRYGDGTAYSLRRPTYEIDALAFGALRPDVKISPRVAPAMIGLGLLEAVPEASVRALADPGDGDGDGISGRANEVWDVRRGALALGRFGWKANQPSVEQQVAGAFLGDLGITSPLFPAEDCPAPQAACKAAPSGGTAAEPEVDAWKLERVVAYSRALAVPARRALDDAQALAGERLFRELGCASCHVEQLVTGPLAGFPELADQTIHPYTDLLLHDLGDGLADGRPDFGADGNEWRTAPLWGLGLLGKIGRAHV